MDPAFMNPEQLPSTSTKQDLLNEEVQKLNRLRRHISKSNNEKKFEGILLKEWNVFLRISEWERVCFTGKEIRARFGKDGNLENGWRWKD